ncbi:alpha/beta fold hydrolase [Xanthobacter dioxanivorans]|uniref:Alpha/beta fold hydrolase n=1 Tax=Xanthobacter dioxanivorans TaxID=2528964 RepID=A0A974PKU1_9HYPH|nr:alpha/beta hydrolase [Xanthobacter dioxanivorans]QRG05014.1 alpha/beta fold hydrolase [Xanthobacter dioxanivorans]
MPALIRDGVRLHFDFAAGSRPPVVLIHGFCCDHTFMAAQFAHLSARGHAVLAPDLRGHGASDKPEQRYSFAEFGDDIAWLCAELGLERPAFVGHSMGGTIAFDLAVRFPRLPRAVALLDSATTLSEAAHAGLAALVPVLAGPEGAAALRRMVEAAFFLPTDDRALCARILDVMGSAPESLRVSGAEALRDYDPTPAHGRLSAPLLYIAANEPTPRSDLARLADLVPHLQVARTVGSGHFCQMEVPAQVNAMLERFLDLALAGE